MANDWKNNKNTQDTKTTPDEVRDQATWDPTIEVEKFRGADSSSTHLLDNGDDGSFVA